MNKLISLALIILILAVPFSLAQQLKGTTTIEKSLTKVQKDKNNEKEVKESKEQDDIAKNNKITNQSGDVVENTFYLPYGEIESGGSAEDKLYEGKELDDTGQYYYGSRYYNPETALFVQPDSIIPDVYDPQQLNPYSFERNNPYSYVDPTGNFGVLAIGAFILGYALVDYAIDKFFGGSELSYAESFGQTIGETITDPQKTGEAAIAFAGGVAIGKLLSKAGASAVSKGDDVVNFASKEQLTNHFEKHSAEFGFKSEKDYLKSAKEFLTGKAGKGVQEYRRVSGDIVRYNSATNEFGIISKNSIIRTYFKPKGGPKYYDIDKAINL